MLIITFGRKIIRKRDGIAADFCPLCRCASVVDVFQLHAQNHISDVGLGMRNLVGHACQCTTCKSQWSMRPNTIRSQNQLSFAEESQLNQMRNALPTRFSSGT